MKGYIKILISLILVIAIITSLYTAPAHAEVATATVGVTLSVVALIAGLMGVNFISDNANQYELLQLFDSTANVADLIVGGAVELVTGANTVKLLFNKAVLDYALSKASGAITDNNIPAYSAGIISANHYYVVNGIDCIYRYGTQYYNTTAYGTVRTGANTIGDVDITYYTASNSTIVFHFNGLTQTKTRQTTTNQPFNIYSAIGTNGNNAIVGYVNADGQGFAKWATFDYTPAEVDREIDYQSNSIDTTIGQNVGASGGIQITMPTQPDYDLNDYLEELLRKLLENDTDDVTVDIEDELDPTPIPEYPTTPMGDLSFNDWQQYYSKSTWSKLDRIGSGTENIRTNTQDIKDGIDDLSQTGLDIKDGVTDLNTNVENVYDKIGDVDTTIDTWGQSIWNKLEQIRSGVQTTISTTVTGIKDTVDNILDGVGDIVDAIENVGTTILEAIETGAISLFESVLTGFTTAFNAILLQIKSFIGIWHYVVEWFTAIGYPFQWIWTMVSGCSYYMVLPIYASIAGFIVIKIYKLIGR